MPTETIRPTTHSNLLGTVTNPANAYNGNSADYAQLAQATAGQVAEERVKGFPADTSPTGRTAVTLKVPGSWSSSDPLDTMRVYFRKISTDAWTLVLSDTKAALAWPAQPAQTERTADITALVGTQPSTDWEAVYQFYNASSGSPDPPNPT